MAAVRRDRAGAEYVWVPVGRRLARLSPSAPLLQHGNGVTHGSTGSLAPLTPGVPAAPAGFWMMRTPVTNALWRVAVEAGAVPEPRATDAYNDAAKAQHPVVFVRRAQARTYAAWVGGRLPTDGEWTWAARGDDGRNWPWGDTPPDATRANCRPYGPGDTTPVGAYPAGASPYGLLDMAGNVWEWVDDGNYVVRGGAFDYFADDVTCGARSQYINGSALNIGFRVVSPGP
jgi:formylglycine-generating enzyme required for sulfatase activity